MKTTWKKMAINNVSYFRDVILEMSISNLYSSKSRKLRYHFNKNFNRNIYVCAILVAQANVSKIRHLIRCAPCFKKASKIYLKSCLYTEIVMSSFLLPKEKRSNIITLLKDPSRFVLYHIHKYSKAKSMEKYACLFHFWNW